MGIFSWHIIVLIRQKYTYSNPFLKKILKTKISAYDTSNRINLAIFFFLICGNVNNLIISVTIHVFTKLWNFQWQSSNEWTLVNPVNHLAWMEISRCFLKGEAVFGQQPSPCCAKKTPVLNLHNTERPQMTTSTGVSIYVDVSTSEHNALTAKKVAGKAQPKHTLFQRYSPSGCIMLWSCSWISFHIAFNHGFCW